MKERTEDKQAWSRKHREKWREKNSIWIIKICKICLRPLDHSIGGKIMKVSRWVERCEGVVSKRFYLWFSGKLSRQEGRALSEKWDDMEGMWKLRTTEEQSKRQNSPSHLPSPEKSLIKWLHLLLLMEMCNLSIGLTPRNCSKLPLYSNRKEQKGEEKEGRRERRLGWEAGRGISKQTKTRNIQRKLLQEHRKEASHISNWNFLTLWCGAHTLVCCFAMTRTFLGLKETSDPFSPRVHFPFHPFTLEENTHKSEHSWV